MKHFLILISDSNKWFNYRQHTAAFYNIQVCKSVIQVQGSVNDNWLQEFTFRSETFTSPAYSDQVGVKLAGRWQPDPRLCPMLPDHQNN